MTHHHIEDLSLSDLKRYVRVPVDQIPLKVISGPSLVNAYITNLSLTGAFVRSDEPLPEGTLLEIEFALPGSSTLIVAKAAVRWCQLEGTTDATQHFNPRGMGLAFNHLSEPHQLAIAQFVEQFLKSMRKQS